MPHHQSSPKKFQKTRNQNKIFLSEIGFRKYHLQNGGLVVSVIRDMHCQDNIIPAYIDIETVIGGVYSDIKPCVCKFYTIQCPWMSLTSFLSEIMSLKHRMNLFHQRTGKWIARIYLVKTILTYFDNSQKVVYSRGLRVLKFMLKHMLFNNDVLTWLLNVVCKRQMDVVFSSGIRNGLYFARDNLILYLVYRNIIVAFTQLCIERHIYTDRTEDINNNIGSNENYTNLFQANSFNDIFCKTYAIFPRVQCIINPAQTGQYTRSHHKCNIVW